MGGDWITTLDHVLSTWQTCGIDVERNEGFVITSIELQASKWNINTSARGNLYCIVVNNGREQTDAWNFLSVN